MVGAPESSTVVAGRVVGELHRAAAEGDLPSIVRLLGLGADVDAVDENGITVLQKAAIGGHVDIVRQLIKSGCAINHQDPKHGNAPLHEASWKGLSQTVEVLVKAKADVHLMNVGGFAPLHLACQNGHNQTCRVFLLAGCKPDIKNNYGDTPLHTAARYGHAGVTRILLSAHANVKEINKNGDTALHIAAAMGRRKLTRMLLEAGVDQTVTNKQGETPLDIATRKSFIQIVDILRNPPPVLTHEERLKKEQKVQRQQLDRSGTPGDGVDAVTRRRKDKRKEKMNDSGTSSRGSGGSKFKEKKKMKSDGVMDPKIRAGRISSWGVDWSPYGCHVTPPTQKQIISPKLKDDSPEPLANGEQYFIDLAGNIKRGPVGVGTSCMCAPLFQSVQQKMEKDKMDLMDHIDAAHGKLGARITSLECQTKGHLNSIGETVEKKIEQERRDCQLRTHLLKENQKNIITSQMNRMQSWVEARLSLHHTDSPRASNKRNLLLGRRTSFRTRDIMKKSPQLVRARSEEAISELGRDDAFSKNDRIYKGLRVLNYPSSMYNIPQRVKEEETSHLANRTKSSIKSTENSSSLYTITNGNHLSLGNLFKVSEPEESSTNECASTKKSSVVSEPTCNGTPLSKSRTRMPLPPNFTCSNENEFQQDVYVSPELNLAVGKLHVRELENLDVKMPEAQSRVLENTEMLPDLPVDTYGINGNRCLNGSSHAHIGSEVHSYKSFGCTELNLVTQNYSVPALAYTSKENMRTFPACMTNSINEPDCSTYLDMDRYRIQAAVRKLYNGFQNDGHVDLSRCSRGVLECSAEHDSHNDSGYSTKLCSTSQGPSPALSGVPTPLGLVDINEKVLLEANGTKHYIPGACNMRNEPEFFGQYRVNGVYPGVQRKIEGCIEKPLYNGTHLNGIVSQGTINASNGTKFGGLMFGRSSLV